MVGADLVVKLLTCKIFDMYLGTETTLGWRLFNIYSYQTINDTEYMPIISLKEHWKQTIAPRKLQ